MLTAHEGHDEHLRESHQRKRPTLGRTQHRRPRTFADHRSKARRLRLQRQWSELLFLALATCYCNDLYREASKRNISIEQVQVEVSGEFGGEGEGAHNISYSASVVADAPKAQILDLMRHTDNVAEIHNTLRVSSPVVLAHCEARESTT